MLPTQTRSTLFPYTTLFRSVDNMFESMYAAHGVGLAAPQIGISKRIAVIDVTFKEDPNAKLVLINPEIIGREGRDRKSTRLNSSHANISYAVFCLKKKTQHD